MDPGIGRYVRELGQEDGGPATAKNALPLKELVRRLLPGSSHLLAGHHSAGVDADLHYRVARALHKLVTPPV